MQRVYRLDMNQKLTDWKERHFCTSCFSTTIHTVGFTSEEYAEFMGEEILSQCQECGKITGR